MTPCQCHSFIIPRVNANDFIAPERVSLPIITHVVATRNRFFVIGRVRGDASHHIGEPDENHPYTSQYHTHMM